MGTFGGAQPIVTDGLVFAVDAANYESYTSGSTTWSDMVGNGNNGTLVNGPTYDGANGGSIVFDGTNDYATFGNILLDTLAGTGNKFTLCSWCNKNNSSTQGPLIVKNADSTAGANERHMAFSFRSNRIDLVLIEKPNNTGWVKVIQNTSDLEYGIWYYMCATYDGSISSTNILDKVKLYINGEEVSTFVLASSGTLNNTLDGSNAPLSIGSAVSSVGNTGSGKFPGKIGYNSIYNRVLTASEISQNYNALKGRFGL